MGKPAFIMKIPKTESRDKTFAPLQEKVKEAAEKQELGAVFCQMKLVKGSYRISGAFYNNKQAKIILAALQEANKLD